MIVETIDQGIDAGVENRSEIENILDQARHQRRCLLVNGVPRISEIQVNHESHCFTKWPSLCMESTR